MSDIVKLDPTVIECIEENIQLIENKEWGKVYQNVLEKANKKSSEEFYLVTLFTEAMLAAGINPLMQGLDYIPSFYLYESEIKSFSIPDHIKHISFSAFDGCDELLHLTLPMSVKDIESYAFFNCDKLSSLQIDNPNIKISFLGFPGYIPRIKFNGDFKTWIQFIKANKLFNLTCGTLELNDKKISDWGYSKCYD